MGVVAGLHAAALYLIATSLGIVPPLIEKSAPVQLLAPEVTPPDVLPPVPQPRLAEVPPLTMPVPVVPTDALDDAQDRIVVDRTNNPPVIPDILPTQGPVVVGVRPDARRPLTQPAYPLTDVRQGNEGSVELEIYVMPDGRIGDARVLKSTGSPTLDQSAVDEAKRKWRMLPATRDGVPYAQWHKLRVVFNLRDR
jgi:protein TonB